MALKERHEVDRVGHWAVYHEQLSDGSHVASVHNVHDTEGVYIEAVDLGCALAIAACLDDNAA